MSEWWDKFMRKPEWNTPKCGELEFFFDAGDHPTAARCLGCGAMFKISEE